MKIYSDSVIGYWILKTIFSFRVYLISCGSGLFCLLRNRLSRQFVFIDESRRCRTTVVTFVAGISIFWWQVWLIRRATPFDRFGLNVLFSRQKDSWRIEHFSAIFFIDFENHSSIEILFSHNRRNLCRNYIRPRCLPIVCCQIILYLRQSTNVEVIPFIQLLKPRLTVFRRK